MGGTERGGMSSPQLIECMQLYVKIDLSCPGRNYLHHRHQQAMMGVISA